MLCARGLMLLQSVLVCPLLVCPSHHHLMLAARPRTVRGIVLVLYTQYEFSRTLYRYCTRFSTSTRTALEYGAVLGYRTGLRGDPYIPRTVQPDDPTRSSRSFQNLNSPTNIIRASWRRRVPGCQAATSTVACHGDGKTAQNGFVQYTHHLYNNVSIPLQF